MEEYKCEKTPQRLYKIGVFSQMNKITIYRKLLS